MLEEGVYLAPSAFESAFVSTSHDRATLDVTERAMAASFQRLTDPSG
jgi:glutamate-1-semialdehyde 2,1-aminomutase